MAKVEVTREHRHYALSIGGEYDVEKMHPLVREWLETGKEPSAREHFSAAMLCIRSRCQAQAVADAEARGRELERKENRDIERLARLRAHDGFEELLDRLGLDWGEVYDSFHEGDSERLAYKLLLQLLRGDK